MLTHSDVQQAQTVQVPAIVKQVQVNELVFPNIVINNQTSSMLYYAEANSQNCRNGLCGIEIGGEIAYAAVRGSIPQYTYLPLAIGMEDHAMEMTSQGISSLLYLSNVSESDAFSGSLYTLGPSIQLQIGGDTKENQGLIVSVALAKSCYMLSTINQEVHITISCLQTS